MHIRPDVLSKLNQTRPEEIDKYASDYTVEAKKSEGPKVTRSTPNTPGEETRAGTAAKSMSAAAGSSEKTSIRDGQGSTAVLLAGISTKENIPLKPQQASPASGNAHNVTSAIGPATASDLPPTPENKDARVASERQPALNHPLSALPDSEANPALPDSRLLQKNATSHPVRDSARAASDANPAGTTVATGAATSPVKAKPEKTKEAPAVKTNAEIATEKRLQEVKFVTRTKRALVDLMTGGSESMAKKIQAYAIMKGGLKDSNPARTQNIQRAYVASGSAMMGLATAAFFLAPFPPLAFACLGVAATIGLARTGYAIYLDHAVSKGIHKRLENSTADSNSKKLDQAKASQAAKVGRMQIVLQAGSAVVMTAATLALGPISIAIGVGALVVSTVGTALVNGIANKDLLPPTHRRRN